MINGLVCSRNLFCLVKKLLVCFVYHIANFLNILDLLIGVSNRNACVRKAREHVLKLKELRHRDESANQSIRICRDYILMAHFNPPVSLAYNEHRRIYFPEALSGLWRNCSHIDDRIWSITRYHLNEMYFQQKTLEVLRLMGSAIGKELHLPGGLKLDENIFVAVFEPLLIEK